MGSKQVDVFTSISKQVDVIKIKNFLPNLSTFSKWRDVITPRIYRRFQKEGTLSLENLRIFYRISKNMDVIGYEKQVDVTCHFSKLVDVIKVYGRCL